MEIPRWEDWPHVVRTQQFSVAALEAIASHAGKFEEAIQQGKPLPRLSTLNRRIIKLVFYESSTRTADTFWTAGHWLNCSVRDIPDPSTFSSAVKGESFRDAIAALTRCGGMGDYQSADCIVIRHKEEGAAAQAAKIVETANGDGMFHRPLAVINAGDGSGQHPTQALGDLCTLFRERRNEGRHPLDEMTLLLPGQVAGSRTSNSLLYLIGKFGQKHPLHVIFSVLPGLEPSPDILEYLGRHRVSYCFEPNFESAIPEADVIYMMRIQRERQNVKEHGYTLADKERYVFRKEHLSLLKAGAFVMHPLPINRDPNDPPAEIDDELTPLALAGDSRLAWFRQSLRHIVSRAALLDLIFAGCDAGWAH